MSFQKASITAASVITDDGDADDADDTILAATGKQPRIYKAPTDLPIAVSAILVAPELDATVDTPELDSFMHDVSHSTATGLGSASAVLLNALRARADHRKRLFFYSWTCDMLIASL